MANIERENFGKKIAAMKGGAPGTEHAAGGEHSAEHGSQVIGKSTVSHHEDGSHSVEHHDGEKSHHPSAGHMGMHMAGKHDGGEHGHIMPHAAGATTHHVDMSGEVQGPHEHGSEDEAYAHLKGSIGDGAEGGTTREDGGDNSYMAGGQEDSSFE